MPTKPNENFITDPDDNPRVAEILSQYSSLIAETRNFGSNVFGWAIERTGNKDHDLAAFSLYRQSLELLDAISVLIKHSCISPSKVLLRSMFEALLSLEYMTQNDFESRGKDYILCRRHKERDSLRKRLKSDPLHQEYLKNLAEDEVLREMERPDISDAEISKAVKEKEELFVSPRYRESESSYQELKVKQKGRNPEWWFNLRGGPKSICDLAAKLKRPAQYDQLYREWSGYSHGTGGMDDHVEIPEPGKIAVLQLRVPRDAEVITLFGISFALAIMRIMIREYAKERMSEATEWYKAELRAGYQDLLKKKIFVE